MSTTCTVVLIRAHYSTGEYYCIFRAFCVLVVSEVVLNEHHHLFWRYEYGLWAGVYWYYLLFCWKDTTVAPVTMMSQ